MSEEPAKRPRFEPISLGGSLKAGIRWLYPLAALVFAGAAVYMHVLEGHGLTSMYVAGPAIGALWFGLRVVMLNLGK